MPWMCRDLRGWKKKMLLLNQFFFLFNLQDLPHYCRALISKSATAEEAPRSVMLLRCADQSHLDSWWHRDQKQLQKQILITSCGRLFCNYSNTQKKHRTTLKSFTMHISGNALFLSKYLKAIFQGANKRSPDVLKCFSSNHSLPYFWSFLLDL